jgi:transposase
MEVSDNCNAETSVSFLRQLRNHSEQPLIVIWDNRPAHYGQSIRDYLKTPGLDLRLIPLPGYSPDFNADEAVWDWVREEVTANLCLGAKSKVQEKVGRFLHGLAKRTGEVKKRCRTLLQTESERLSAEPNKTFSLSGNVATNLV